MIVLKFTNEDGKSAVECEVAKSFHAAIIRAAKAKGITLQKWIENAVRAKCARLHSPQGEAIGGAR